MTNLFEFLNDLLDMSRSSPDGAVYLTPAYRVWIENFLRSSDVELHLRATPTGKVIETPEGPLPEMITNYMVRGEPVQIFELLSDAALQNPGIFRLFDGVASFVTDHADKCPSCREQIEACNMTDPGPDFWNFSPPNHP